MVALLAVLGLALAVGVLTRRITPAVELLLLVLIAGIVLAEFASWSGGDGRSAGDFLRSLLPALR